MVAWTAEYLDVKRVDSMAASMVDSMDMQTVEQMVG
jgi:hypothetical protein